MRFVVDGTRHDLDVPPHRTLAAVLRDDCGVTGCRIACTDGTCGACAVLVDGDEVRSCLMLAVQGDGARVGAVQRVAEM